MTLSLTLIVKVDGAIRVPTYDCLLVNNSKICLSAVSYTIWQLEICLTFEFDLSRSLKVKVNGAIRKPTHDFLLVKNSKYMPIYSTLWSNFWMERAKIWLDATIGSI